MHTASNTHIVIGCEDEAMRDGLRDLQKAIPSLMNEQPVALRIKLEDILASIVHSVMDSRIPELRNQAQPLEIPALFQPPQSEDCLAIATWIGGDKHGEQAGQILMNATEEHIEDVRTRATIQVHFDQRVGVAYGRVNPDGKTVDWISFQATGDLSIDNAPTWVDIAAPLLAPESEIVMLPELNARIEAAQVASV
ncbi:MAG: hypothetical protein IKZ87_04290 [Actinomycetaceae bacterium]|nr:hypothetical protein [Actinomycetaceae bacterium]